MGAGAQVNGWLVIIGAGMMLLIAGLGLRKAMRQGYVAEKDLSRLHPGFILAGAIPFAAGLLPLNGSSRWWAFALVPFLLACHASVLALANRMLDATEEGHVRPAEWGRRALLFLAAWGLSLGMALYFTDGRTGMPAAVAIIWLCPAILLHMIVAINLDHVMIYLLLNIAWLPKGLAAMTWTEILATCLAGLGAAIVLGLLFQHKTIWYDRKTMKVVRETNWAFDPDKSMLSILAAASIALSVRCFLLFCRPPPAA